MSYIQIEIGGRERGLKFTQGTTMLLQDSPVMDMNESERKAFGVPYIFWAALKTNCAIKGERFTKTENGQEVAATIEDVFDWVDKVPQETIMQVIDTWSEVNKFKADVPEQPALSDDEKKNQPEHTEPNVIESPAAS